MNEFSRFPPKEDFAQEVAKAFLFSGQKGHTTSAKRVSLADRNEELFRRINAHLQDMKEEAHQAGTGNEVSEIEAVRRALQQEPKYGLEADSAQRIYKDMLKKRQI